MSRKIAVILLSVMTLALLAVGVIILLQLQQDQSPEESDAAGFGSSADRSLYLPVANTFKDVGCVEYFNIGEVYSSGYLPLYNLIVRSSKFSTDDLTEADEDILVKNCLYDLGDNKTIRFNVLAYNLESQIPDTRDELYANVLDSYLDSQLDSGVYEFVRYFYGQDLNDSNQCHSIIFHFQNEFRYAKVDYEGFESCSSLTEINKVLTDNFAKKIDGVMENYSLSLTYLSELDPDNYNYDAF